LSELDDKSSAVRWWRAFDTLPTHPHHTIAKDMLAVLVSDSLKKNDIKKASEQKKLQYLHYQNKNLAHKEYFEVVKTIEEQSFVANAVLDRIEFVLEKNQLDSALSYRSALTGLLNLNNATLNRIKMCDLRLLAETGQFEKMLPLLNEPDENRKTAAQKKLYRAVYQAGMKTDATKLFEEAQKSLPFEPVLYEKAAKYFREIKKTEKAYEFVLKGIQIAPENPKIYRIYLFLALELGYRRYAEEAYRELRSLISPSERDILKAEYEKEYQKLLDNEQNW
jgi:tetratricopeptide (TPR) repeat protein